MENKAIVVKAFDAVIVTPKLLAKGKTTRGSIKGTERRRKR